MDVMGIKIGPQAEQLARKRDESIQPIVRAPVTSKCPEQLGKKLNPEKQKNMSEQKGYCMVLVLQINIWCKAEEAMRGSLTDENRH
ncbi:hypothetical protein CDAR_450341 [Caerostris darwini]|uniref:Uncharacterized protein n=1 Tax=Caerostris darwini TaxID=1538125 RepID=A0AAV4NEW6_9ARAC|nr:hypothetical protein CDAR_450341 [Caerostris darwini]